MKILTAQQWQDICDLWRQPGRTDTVTSIARRLGVNRNQILNGFRHRGMDPTSGPVNVYCACGCGVTVGRTNAHAEEAGRLFRNMNCWRRWKGQQAPTSKPQEQNRRRLVIQTVPLAVRKTWPKTWCVHTMGNQIHVYRTPSERGRVRVTGAFISPLFVLHHAPEPEVTHGRAPETPYPHGPDTAGHLE